MVIVGGACCGWLRQRSHPICSISHQRKASNTVNSNLCDCNQIRFSSDKTKHRWPSAFLSETPCTVLRMSSRIVAESNGHRKRDNDKGVGSRRVLTVVDIELLVFRAAAPS